MVVSFSVFVRIGVRISQEVPPIPARAVDTAGAVVVADGDIDRGQTVWHAVGVWNSCAGTTPMTPRRAQSRMRQFAGFHVLDSRVSGATYDPPTLSRKRIWAFGRRDVGTPGERRLSLPVTQPLRWVRVPGGTIGAIVSMTIRADTCRVAFGT